MSDHPPANDHRSIVRRSVLPQSASHPLVTPITPSSVYVAGDIDTLHAQYEGREPGFTYAREGHPNALVLAQKIDWMEGADGGQIASSGMAAISAMFLSLLRSGDHVIGSNQLYGRTSRLLNQDLVRFGVTATLVDPSDAAAVEAAVRPTTKLIVVETVSNPTMVVADMVAITALANEHGILLAVDNTFCTPRGFQPLGFGADIVIHSVTKLLAGHSDVTLGYVAAKDSELNRSIYDAIATFGFNASPFDCWLAERGLHSFELRYDRACANALKLAQTLDDLEGVEAVLYPGLTDDPGHGRAQALFDGNYGNMLSFRLEGGLDAANRFIRAVPELPFAPTLGDVATTISHPPSSSHRAVPVDEQAAIGITPGFIRVSVGIEDAALILAEFAKGIAAARS